MTSQQQQSQMALQARQRNFQFLAARRQQQAQSQTTGQPMGRSMATAYDYLPIVEPSDLGWIGGKPAYIISFESACRTGSVSTIQSVTTSQELTPITLHNGLVATLRAGHVGATRCLLQLGTLITPRTAENILFAPMDRQVPLFDLLAHHGWDPNTPDRNGAPLLPRVVKNIHLLKWFLDHGANPNLGSQEHPTFCKAVEAAAETGTVEAVRMLLDAGAHMDNGGPLYYAAGVCPPGENPYMGTVSPSTDFDEDRIAVMELLVERGANVNQKLETRHMVPGYPLVIAVMAGAVGRVKWLLEHGADVRLKGAFGSAVDYANGMGSDEMKRVIGDAVERLG
ncbi:uncharacterized protein N7484_010616 [Penicillium longicatenatum]|uniref:uncharacterized protein n=1 Tax=Penicillium longicatenatum TaxID=1561947 RepID=UPI002549554F|nr:uncharacterized protein N7484_010616 [Penicillium longicatenatum]KAJ5630516.1 hypothetical protein N7484_010616 [Penicillium longicatenatum]